MTDRIDRDDHETRMAMLDDLVQRVSTLETSMLENTRQTSAMSAAMEHLSVSMAELAKNTAPMVRLTTDLAAGTFLMCRIAMTIRFVLEIAERIAKPVLFLALVCAALAAGKIPPFLKSLVQLFGI